MPNSTELYEQLSEAGARYHHRMNLDVRNMKYNGNYTVKKSQYLHILKFDIRVQKQIFRLLSISFPISQFNKDSYLFFT